MIRDKWAQVGYEAGFLGYPLTDENALSGGAFSVFQGGSIYYSPSTGAHSIQGLIRDKWAALGYETGPLGYPITDEIPTFGREGLLNGFQGRGGADGAIYYAYARESEQRPSMD